MTEEKYSPEIDQDTEQLKKQLNELEKNAMYYSQIRYLLQELVDNPDPNVFLVTLLRMLTELTGGLTTLAIRNGHGDWKKLSLEGELDPKRWQPVQQVDTELFERAYSDGDIGYSRNTSDVVEFQEDIDHYLNLRKHSNLILVPVKGQTPLMIEIFDVTQPANIPRYIDEIKEFMLPLVLTIQYAMVVRARDEAQERLQAINNELEAFSYSVSHDLRAPLRSLDGFSRILLEKYADVLDEKGSHYLKRVRAAGQRMEALIEDLLRLSRITRAEIQVEIVDLSAISKEIATELQGSEPDRQVQFVIKEGIVVRGDEKLIQVLMTNLLSNAWKFTSKHLTARIEVGTIKVEEIKTYFVRDDGAGFHMEYARKLFTPFQRLHTSAEFEGTGIGLATVQRIIHRHSGTIWAESAVEGGATFYFTLDQDQS